MGLLFSRPCQSHLVPLSWYCNLGSEPAACSSAKSRITTALLDLETALTPLPPSPQIPGPFTNIIFAAAHSRGDFLLGLFSWPGRLTFSSPVPCLSGQRTTDERLTSTGANLSRKFFSSCVHTLQSRSGAHPHLSCHCHLFRLQQPPPFLSNSDSAQLPITKFSLTAVEELLRVAEIQTRCILSIPLNFLCGLSELFETKLRHHHHSISANRVYRLQPTLNNGGRYS